LASKEEKFRRKQLTRRPITPSAMPPATFEELRQTLRSGHVSLDDFGVPEPVIVAAEREVGLPFPPSYRWFLANHGLGSYRDYPLLGLGCPFEGEPCPEEYDVLAYHRGNLSLDWDPQHLLVLTAAEGDEVYYLALNEPGPTGECPVYLWPDHENYASSYGGFLFRLSRQG